MVAANDPDVLATEVRHLAAAFAEERAEQKAFRARMEEAIRDGAAVHGDLAARVAVLERADQDRQEADKQGAMAALFNKFGPWAISLLAMGGHAKDIPGLGG